MRFAIAIPILNQFESFYKTINSLQATQFYDNRIIILDNGSSEELDFNKFEFDVKLDIYHKEEKNIGVPKALNKILDLSKKLREQVDYVFFTHSDIEMFENHWDLKVQKAIEENGNVGVAGFYGAMGIGTGDIYKTPYQMQQLVRTNPIAGNRCKQDPRIHGHIQFNQDWIKCGVLDGFSLIVQNKGVLRFDESFGEHHMYDNDICLQAYANYKDVICINCDVIHYGGRTDVNESWNKEFGKDS